MPVLETIQLCKTYGAGPTQVEALRDVSLRFEAREFVAILGPSGAGKSTLLHLLGGVDTPSSGGVLLNDFDLSHLNDTQRSIARRRAIAFVFQKINLIPTLTAIDNVALPLVIDGLGRRAARARAAVAMERIGIGHRTTHFPSQMSGGEQQRTAIARAMAVQPTVILADEPTGALDTANSRRVFALLKQCAYEGQAVVVATHDPQIAAHADRVVRLTDGCLLPDAPGGSNPP